jgi:hypothetical protein
MRNLNSTEEFDPQLAIYCWLHPVSTPELREKKLRLHPWKTYDKNGQMTMGRSCHECWNTVLVDQEKARENKVKLEGYSQEVTADGI